MAVVDQFDSYVDLTLAYIDEIAIISEIVAAELRRIFESMGSLDRADIADFISEALPMASAGRAEAINLTSGYLADLTNESPAQIDLREFTPAWEDPFLRTWHNLKEGQTFEQAREGGASQAEALGTDIVREGANDRMANPGVKVIGYRRVVSLGACEWCQVVATQIYHQMQTTEWHHNCHCRMVAITEKNDPALKINQERLKELKASGAVQRATDAKSRQRARTQGGI